jgi:hypothetical protein
MTSRACVRCGAALSGRRDRRYCSGACRTAAGRERRGVRRGLLLELANAVGDPAVAEVSLAEGLTRAAETNPWAAAWVLERRFPERWGPVGRRARDEEWFG